MASLLGWLGGGVKRLANTVNNDVIQPINRDVVQPAIGQPAPGAQPNAIANLRYGLQGGGGVINNFRTAATIANRNLVQPTQHLLGIGPEDVRALIGIGTHNDAATQAALQRGGQDVQAALNIPRGIAQSALRVPLSLADAATKSGTAPLSIRPTNRVEKFVLGDQPVQSYRGMAQSQGLGQTGLTAAGDLLNLLGAKTSLEKGASTVNTLRSNLQTAKEIKDTAKHTGNWNKGYNVSDLTRAQVGTPTDVPVKGVKNGIAVNNSAAKYNPLSDQSGYIRVGFPNAKELSDAVKSKINEFNYSNKSSAADRIANNKLTPTDVQRTGAGTFSQTDIKTMAQHLPDFKANPVMKFDPAYQAGREAVRGTTPEPYPALVFDNGKTRLAIRADKFFPEGTDLSKIPKGEQVDMSQALGKGSNKIPAITESKIGTQLPTPGVKTAPVKSAPVAAAPPVKAATVPPPTELSKLVPDLAGSSKPSIAPGPGEGLRAGVDRINKATGSELPQSVYTKRPQATLEANAQAAVKKDLNAATGQVQKDLAQAPGKLTDQQLANAYAVADKHAQAGNTELSNEILTKTLAHDTATAQALAARGMLTKQTPGGIQKMVLNAFKKANIPFEGDLATKVNALMDGVRGTTAGTPEREFAVRKLANAVTNELPRGKWRAASEFWRAMLISGPQTLVKVGISQPISGLQAYGAGQVASLADAAHSLVTGAPRTRGFTPLAGLVSGTKSGLSDAVTKLRTGVDVPGSGGYVRSLEQNLATGAHQTPIEHGIFNAHAAVAKTTHNIIRDNTLASLGKAQGLNQNLHGADLKAFVTDYVKNPPKDAYNHALQAGEEAVNQQRTAIGNMAGNLQRAGGKNGAAGPGIIVAPITRAPGAIATNALYNYSGVKLAKTALYDGLIKHGVAPNFSRTLSEDFGKAVVGAGGVGALGAVLGATGNLTPAKFANAKDASLAKAEGKPPGSIRIPGLNKWISLNALGPVGIELAGGGGVGAGYKDSGVGGAIAQGAGAAGQEIAQQPYLQGIAGVGNVLNAPKQYAKSFVNNLAGSVIPAFSSQTATGIDPNQRQINYSSLTDVLKSRVPGVRQSIPAAPDVLGNRNFGANPSGTVLGGVAGTLDALKPSTPKGQNDPVTQELNRLQTTLPSTDSPSIALPKRDQTVNGQKITLNDKQLADYTGQSGQLINQGVASLIQTPEYKAASDTAKASAINDIISKSRDLTKSNIATGAAPTPTATAALTKAAQLKVAKDSFDKSGKNYQVVGDTVLRRDPQGNITATPKIKFDYQVGTATMTKQKNNGDLAGWLNTAQGQLASINKQLQDPSTDPLEALTLQNDAQSILNNAAKYQSYGGFTKGSGSSGKVSQASTAGFKVKSAKLPKITGVKVAKAKAFKAPTTRKLAVSSIPKISSKKFASIV